MDEGSLVIKSESKGDLVSKTKTIYEAGAGEILLMPMITTYSNLIKSFESISNTKSGINNIIPKNLDLQKLLGQ